MHCLGSVNSTDVTPTFDYTVNNDCFSDKIKEVLNLDSEIKKLSEVLYTKKSLLVMGRGFNFATCLEGALVSSSEGRYFCNVNLF